MKMLFLSAIDLDAERNFLSNDTGVASAAGRELDFTEDDLEQPIANAAAVNTAIAEALTNAPVGVYYPVAINADEIREFYPRKGARAGTRIVFKNGAARPVKELFAEVKTAFEAA